MQVHVCLAGPEQFMQYDATTPKDELHVFELYLGLLDAGWQFKIQSSAAMNIMPFKIPKGDRCAWVKPDDEHFDSKYLLVLLLVSTDEEFVKVLLTNKIASIEHCKSNTFYKHLLDLRIRKPDAANDDDDDSMFEDEDAATKRRRTGKAKNATYRLPQSFKRGVISFKYVRPSKKNPLPGYQADCPRRSHIIWHERDETQIKLELQLKYSQ